MTQLLPLLCFLTPAVTWAQSQQQAAKQPASEQPLSGSANVRIAKLAQRTVLYRYLRDTLTMQYTRTVRAGGYVVIGRASQAHWLAVRRARNATRFSSDTTTYYIPLRALKGAQTYVLL